MLSEEDKKFLTSVMSNGPKILGMKVSEVMIVLSIFVSLGSFYFGTRNDISSINISITKLTTMMDYVTKFTVNSDKFHSQMTNVEFDQGRPMNGDNIALMRERLSKPITGNN